MENMESKKENSLLIEANKIYKDNLLDSLSDVFEIELDSSYSDNKIYRIRTMILMLVHKGYYTVNIKEYNEDDEYFKGGYVDLNENLENEFIENVTEFTFKGFYTSLFISLQHEITNIEGFKDMYSSLYEEYKKSKNVEIKKYINRTYGMMANKYVLDMVDFNSIKAVINLARHLLIKIKKEFIGHIIYVDTDCFYIARYHEIEKRFLETINKYTEKHNLEYDITHHKLGMFRAKKKFLIIDSDKNYHLKGIRSLK